MKKICIVLLGMFPVTLLAQNKQVNISGKTTDAENCGALFSYVAPDGHVKRDTTFVKNGRFSFQSTAYDERTIAQVIVFAQPKDYSILFYLEPGNIQLDVYGDKNLDQRIGTPLNKQLQEFAKLEGTLLDSANAGKGPKEKVNQYSPDGQPIVLEAIRRFTITHPHSPIGMDQMENVVRAYKNPEALTKVYNMMDSQWKDSKGGKVVATTIEAMRKTAVGNTAPDFTLPDTKGEMLALSSLKGKYVLVDFWATWCGPCMAEMPNVKQAYGRFKGDKFEILGVSLDKPDAKEKWLEVIDKQKLVWPQVSDLKFWDSKVVPLYDLSSIPMNFLLDPSGKIIAKNLRGEALSNKLAEVLK
jgi:peroxiredoxin